MEIDQYSCYKAKVNYHRTDDLKEGSPLNGEEIIVQAVWIADKGEKFEGQWIFMPSVHGFWLPACDLIIMDKVDSKIYYARG